MPELHNLPEAGYFCLFVVIVLFVCCCFCFYVCTDWFYLEVHKNYKLDRNIVRAHKSIFITNYSKSLLTDTHKNFETDLSNSIPSKVFILNLFISIIQYTRLPSCSSICA